MTPPTPGSSSGLDKTFSNFVFGETLQPFSNPITLMSKQQFDSSTLQLDTLRRDRQGELSPA